MPHCSQQRFVPCDIEIGILLTGKRQVRQVLGIGGRADSNSRCSQGIVGGQNLVDDGVLSDHHLVKFFHHYFVVLAKLLQEVFKVTFFGQQSAFGKPSSNQKQCAA